MRKIPRGVLYPVIKTVMSAPCSFKTTIMKLVWLHTFITWIFLHCKLETSLIECLPRSIYMCILQFLSESGLTYMYSEMGCHRKWVFYAEFILLGHKFVVIMRKRSWKLGYVAASTWLTLDAIIETAISPSCHFHYIKLVYIHLFSIL